MSDRAPNPGSLRPRPSRSPSGRAVANTGAGVALAGGGSLLLPRRRWRPSSWSSSSYNNKDLIVVVVVGLPASPCVLVLQEEAAARLPSSLVVILIAIHHKHHHTLRVRGGDLAERCRCCCASLLCLGCVSAPLHCLSGVCLYFGVCRVCVCGLPAAPPLRARCGWPPPVALVFAELRQEWSYIKQFCRGYRWGRRTPFLCCCFAYLFIYLVVVVVVLPSVREPP